MALTVCKFSKFSGAACLRVLKSSFGSSIFFKLTLPQKYAKKCQNMLPSRKKILNTPLTWTHFQKRAYLRSFPGLTPLSLVNIQPNSKLLPPTKIFWIRYCVEVYLRLIVVFRLFKHHMSIPAQLRSF